MGYKLKIGDKALVTGTSINGEIVEIKKLYLALGLYASYYCKRINGHYCLILEDNLQLLNKEEDMSKFKIGDKVVRTGREVPHHGMDIGDTDIVVAVGGESLNLKRFGNGHWDKYFEKVEQSKKDLLKNGDEIHYRNGQVRYLLNGKIYCETCDGFLSQLASLSEFDNDLTRSTGFSAMDIMLVLRDGEQVFKREEEPKPEIKELTLKEIADKFGYDVKHVRVKEG